MNPLSYWILIKKNSGWDDSAWRHHVLFYTVITATYTLLFCISMFFSYHTIHPDEYYQIIEFASAKLGISQINALPWEYFYQIRSWIQPAIFYTFARTCFALSITDPFFILGSWSTFSALILFVPSMFVLFLSCHVWIKQRSLRFAAVRSLSLFWVLPYMGSHPNSELWGMCAFVIAFALISLSIDFHQKNWNMYLTPLCISVMLLGTAFQLRFQTAFLSLGLCCWMIYNIPHPIKKATVLACFALTGIVTVIIFAKLDAWGYESPGYVTSFMNYFYANITEGISKNFGISPIFWYFYASHHNPAPYLSILLMISTIFFWFLYPKHIFTWISLPFFVVHCLVPHKEVRFLLPLLPFSILSTFFLLQKNEIANNPFLNRMREKVCDLWESPSYRIPLLLFWGNQTTLFIMVIACFGQILSFRMISPKLDTWVPPIWNAAFQKIDPQANAFLLKVDSEMITKKGVSFGAEEIFSPYSSGWRGFVRSKRPNCVEVTFHTVKDFKDFFSNKDQIRFPTVVISGIDLQKDPELLSAILPIKSVEIFPNLFAYKIFSWIPVVKNWIQRPIFLYTLQIPEA